MIGNAAIEAVEAVPGGYVVYSKYNQWVSPTQPILCTGFEGSLKQIAHLFNWSEGYARLTEEDESTITPGLFVVGPSVRHGKVIFCFIYMARSSSALSISFASVLPLLLMRSPNALVSTAPLWIAIDKRGCFWTTSPAVTMNVSVKDVSSGEHIAALPYCWQPAFSDQLRMRY